MTMQMEEVRTLNQPIEQKDGRIVFGTAIKFNEWSKPMKAKDGYLFREKILPTAVREKDLQFIKSYYDHVFDTANLLGTVKAGTVKVELQEDGIYIEIDVPKTTVGNDFLEQVKRGDIEGWSFGMRNIKASWGRDANGCILRTITDMNLRTIDPVHVPAYNTIIELRHFIEMPETQTLEASVEALTEKVNQLNNQLGDLQKVNNEPEEVRSLKDQIKTLENKIATLEDPEETRSANQPPANQPPASTIHKENPNQSQEFQVIAPLNVGDEVNLGEIADEIRGHTEVQTGGELETVSDATQANLQAAKDALKPASIWHLLGINHESNVHDQIIPIMDLLPESALAFLEETGAATEIKTNLEKKQLTPKRLAGKMIFSKRLLRRDKVKFSTKALQGGKWVIDHKTEVKFFSSDAGSTLSPAGMGHSSNSTPVDATSSGTLSKALIKDWLKLVDSAYGFDVGEPLMVCSKDVFWEMTEIKVDAGSGKFLMEVKQKGGKGKPSIGYIKDLDVTVYSFSDMANQSAFFGSFEGVVANTFAEMVMQFEDVTLRDSGQVKYNFDTELDFLNAFPAALLHISNIQLPS